MDEPLFIVENLAEYKSNLEADEDVICAGMSKEERKAYQMGVQNMYAILQDVIEYDSSKGNYNIFVPENIQGEEFDLSDFVKWDAKRNEDKFDRKKIKITDMSSEENKVYIVSSGEYSDYHIDAVFLNEEKAKAYCDCHSDRQIEEYELNDDDIYTPFNIVEITYHLNPIYVADLEPKFEFEKLNLEEYGNYDKNSEKIQLTGGDDRIILQRRLPDVYDEETIRRKYTKAFYDLKAEIKYMLSQQDTSTYEKQLEAEKNILEAIKDKFGIEKE